MLFNFYKFLLFFLNKKTLSYCKEIIFVEIIKYLKLNKFEIIKIRKVINLLIINKKKEIFIGHIDVVDSGYISWIKKNFFCVCYKKKIICRGIVDMKGGICSFLFLSKNKNFILTNDEENLSIYGTQYIVNVLIYRKTKYFLFYSCEPTSNNQVGDNIRISRRGSYNFNLIFMGKQKHCAYLGKNIINYSIQKLIKINKNIFYNDIFEINNIFSGNGVNNTTPNIFYVKINYRFFHYKSIILFKKKIFQSLKKNKNYFKWVFSGIPFICYKNFYLKLIFNSVNYIQNIFPKINFLGGTSDLRYCYYFYNNSNCFEIGLLNKTIHKINENSDFDNLYILYLIIKKFKNGIR
ncbi:M20/M25/M40 family metallo-hydrolase [Candidatus Carsonella ruddii]|uniref:Succinyl-diaminopimelate desuccinylase n=1 Tax=Carsonella ruddii TaxID=114186 RepID=A0AAE7G5B5_CARRU|nr:M20/M25/M40 family metallo-hydrolase [Candidatus Carsonella ruddii]AGS06507.1 succinyl-diaminopimelate desuccinylase [Candidatus Carsonella ruddii DC]QLK13989.1 succinyl-diaminopimelate desuccinylase [Candidatus Carsonella ruddii]